MRLALFRPLAFVAALALGAPQALAAPVGVDGFDVLITLGFNPQPEPPPEFDFTTSQVVNPFDVVARVSGIEPQPFTTGPFSGIDPTPFLLFLDASGGTLVPPDPIVPVSNMFEVMLRTAGGDLSLRFTLFFPDGTPMRAEVNSQMAGSLTVSLDLIDADGGDQPDEVAVRMQVLRNGDPLGLTEVPLPAPALLLGAALLALGARRRRG